MNAGRPSAPAEEVYPLNYHRGLQPRPPPLHSFIDKYTHTSYDMGPERMSLHPQTLGLGELLSFSPHMLHRCTFRSLHLYCYFPEEMERACISLHRT